MVLAVLDGGIGLAQGVGRNGGEAVIGNGTRRRTMIWLGHTGDTVQVVVALGRKFGVAPLCAFVRQVGLQYSATTVVPGVAFVYPVGVEHIATGTQQFAVQRVVIGIAGLRQTALAGADIVANVGLRKVAAC